MGELQITMYTRLVILCLLSMNLGAIAAEPESIPAGIEQLGARDYADREEASRFLWMQGLAAREALVKAAESDDPEVQTRARDILAKIDSGVLPDTPPDVAELLGDWRKRNRGDRMRIMNELLKRDEPVPTTIIALLENETDAIVVRKTWEDQELIPHLVDLYLANKLEGFDMERLLRTRYVANEELFPDYVAWMMLTDRLEAGIALARAELGADTDAVRTLRVVRLLWAAEKHQEAIDLAAQAELTDFRDRLLIEDRQYGKLLDLLVAKAKPEDAAPDDLAQYLILARLSGRTELADQVVARMVKLGSAGDYDDRVDAAAILVLNRRIDEAMALLADTPQADAQLQLVLATAGETEALPILQAVLADPKRHFEDIAADSVQTIKRNLGDPEAIEAQIKELRSRGVNARGDLLSALIAANRREDAYTLGLSLIREDESTAMDVAWRFHPQGQLLWHYLAVTEPEDNVVERFNRWKALVESITDDEIDACFQALAERIEAVSPDSRTNVRNVVADALFDRGHADAAYATILPAFGNKNVGTMLFAATVCLKFGRWEEACKYYDDILESELGNVRLMRTHAILHAEALDRAGHAKEAAAKRRRADLVTLANANYRNDMIVQLDRLEFYEASARQMGIARRLLGGDEMEGGMLSMLYGYMGYTKNPTLQDDPGAQADSLEHSLIAGDLDASINSYVQTVSRIEVLRMKAALAAKEYDAAIAHYRVADRYSPTDSDVTIALVTGLRDGGRAEDAATILDGHVAFWEATLKTFPNHATAHNNLAWACARSHMRLDVALAHATRAVELEPRSAAFLDTLAETHFQLGDRDTAVATQKRAALYADDVAFMRGRIKEFQTDPLPGE